MNKKALGALDPRRYSPSPQGAKYVSVTQDKSPRGKVEVCNEDLFSPISCYDQFEIWQIFVRNFGKRTVGHPLEDKGDSVD